MQKFWDSTLALEPPDDYDTQSELSAVMAADGAEPGRNMYPSLGLGNSFAFKFEDIKGRVHRFNCGTESLDELVSAVMQRIGASTDQDRPQILYEDDEGDKVLLSTDSDLVSAVSHARVVGQKVLRLQLDYSESIQETRRPQTGTDTVQGTGGVFLHSGILASAVIITAVGLMVYLKRAKL